MSRSGDSLGEKLELPENKTDQVSEAVILDTSLMSRTAEHCKSRTSLVESSTWEKIILEGANNPHDLDQQ